jgi:hypothetical protein
MSCLTFVTSFTNNFIHIQREKRKSGGLQSGQCLRSLLQTQGLVELTGSGVACISHCFFELLCVLLEFDPQLRRCVAWTKVPVFAEF